MPKCFHKYFIIPHISNNTIQRKVARSRGELFALLCIEFEDKKLETLG